MVAEVCYAYNIPIHTYLQRETKRNIWKTREIPDFTDTGELVSPVL